MKQVRLKLLLLTLAVFAASGCGATDGESPVAIAANETAAIVRLRAIAEAERSYFAQSGSYGTLEKLVAQGLIADESKGRLNGYKFEVMASSKGFLVTAVPEEFGVTGKRSFFIDQSNIVRGREKKGGKASAADPAV
jgi:hypothetical protein